MDATRTSAGRIRDAIDAVRYEDLLADYMASAWPHALEPSRYMTNWHIDCVCDYLTAAADWKLGSKVLIFSFPPRHMKSIGLNVFFPSWLWAQDPKEGHPDNPFAIRPNSWRGPGTKLCFIAYGSALSESHGHKCLTLIRSPWYQRKWGDRFRLITEGVQKFENNHGGHRQALSMGGALTGFGGHIIVLDDLHNRLSDSFENDRLKVLDAWDNAMGSRLDDPVNGLFILAMQRTAPSDLIGHVLAKEFNGIHVCLPYEFESKHPYVFQRPDNDIEVMGKTFDRPLLRMTDSSGGTDIGPRKGEAWEDRRREGEVLWPERFPKEVMAPEIAKMTSHDAAGQYQQRPSAAEGGMFKRHWFANRLDIGDYYAFAEAKYLTLCRAWDLAWTEPGPGKEPDWSVGVLMGRDHQANIFYILDVVRGRWSPADLERVVLATARRDGETCTVRIPQDPGAGSFVAAYLSQQLAGYPVRIEAERNSKGQRAAPVAAQAENRLLVLLKGHWNHDWIEEHCAFRPDLKHQRDDQVDATSAAFRQIVRQPEFAMIAV